MKMDPYMKALVDQMAASGMPTDFAEIGAAGLREQSQDIAAMLGKGPDVARIEDVTMSGLAGPIPARLYVPAGDVAGLIVFYHGGGWVIGNIEGYDSVSRRLACASHCALVSVGYRLAPEHPFPVPVEDCYAALEWASTHRTSITGHSLPLVVAGDSAGGNLAAAVALAARDRNGPQIALQLLIYPVMDADFTRASYTTFAEGFMLTAKAMYWFWDQYVPDLTRRADPLAAPLRATDLSGLPDAMVETAGFDPLRDEGETYADRLERAGVSVQLRRWDGLCHGFFQMAMVLPPSGDAVDRMGKDIAMRLAG